MSDLTSRFREIRVVMDGEASTPARPPDDWLSVRTMGNVLMFVETRFSEARLSERLATLNGGVRRVETQPMPLRSIFITMARAARETAGTKG